MALAKILISRCFLGEKVKYNGEDNQLNLAIIKQWQAENRLVPVCPEVAGGLTIPRPPAEIVNQRVINSNGDDVSQAFYTGASIALRLCQQHGIRFALLKESSPSCGSSSVYDGSFTGRKIAGQGLTTQLLGQHGIVVYSEKTIELLNLAVKKMG